MKTYKVFMHSRPAVGRTFYDGSVVVNADSEEQAVERAITKAARVHGHRDWKIDRMEIER